MSETAYLLVAGLAALSAVVFFGATVLGCLGIEGPKFWFWPMAGVTGVVLADGVIFLALAAGAGAATLCGIAAGIAVIALFSVRRPARWSLPRPLWPWLIPALAVGLNLFIALAPSTKIDELHYHMLAPQRIVADRALLPYREPFESAIYPQMSWQFGLSALHALGVPEAGNVISWGLGVLLLVLIGGLVPRPAAPVAVGVAAVGLYPTVWHVTSGPHAYGDLATVLAATLLFLPSPWLSAAQRLGLLSLAACAAALTKVSLLPLAAAFTVIAIVRWAPEVGWRRAVAIPALLWSGFYAPIVLWSTAVSGSPWGLVTASVFHSAFFPAATIAHLAESRAANQTGWISALKNLLTTTSIGISLSVAILAVRARQHSTFLILLAGQIVVIAILLPHDFRFLGGLQFVALILAAAYIPSKPWLVLPLCLPWLAVQSYYALPFVQATVSSENREAFRARTIAFSSDFRALATILPPDAVLYSPKDRIPSYYAPRPVIFHPVDLRPGQRLYLFATGSEARPAELHCGAPVYENATAAVAVFRTPGRQPLRGPVRVYPCDYR